MKRVTTNKATLLFVEVPEGMEHVGMLKDGSGIYMSRYKTEGVGTARIVPLPPGPWRLLGRVKEIPEDVAKGLVGDLFDMFYEDYTKVGLMDSHYGAHFVCDTAKESLLSIPKSTGMSDDCLVLVKE